MASFLFTTFLFDALRGDISPSSDAFAARLIDSDGVAAVEPRHEKRSEIAGQTGNAVPVLVAVVLDAGNERVLVRVGPATWTAAVVTSAMGLIVYQDTGTDTTDRLVAFVHFDAPVSVSPGDINVPEFDIEIGGVDA